MIKAIIFDKDGTLIELGKTWDEPTVLMLEELLSMTTLTTSEKISLAREMGINEEGTGIVPNSLFAAGSIHDQAAALSKYLPIPLDEVEDRIEDGYYRYLSEKEIKATLTPGTVELLESLREDYILGIITNDNHKLALASLDKLDILQYFDFVGCADQYGPKPNPSGLHEISRRFNITLDEMIYVGDSALDMQFSKFTKAGIGYAENKAAYDHLIDADYIIEDLRETKAIVELINKQGVE